MDVRHEPQQFLAPLIVTANNFEDNLESIDQALGLKAGTLRSALIQPDSLAYFKEELNALFNSIYNPLNTSLYSVTDAKANDSATSALIAKKSIALKSDLNKIFTHMSQLRDQLIAQQIAESENAKQTILDSNGCNAGNHGLMLATFKRNIAIALQAAAHAFYLDHEATRKVPLNFNKIFKSHSHINQYGVITHYDQHIDLFADSTLNEIQQTLTEIISDCLELKEEGILQVIIRKLLSINALPGNALTHHTPMIRIQHNDLHFSPAVHAIETSSQAACHTARKLLRDLATSIQNKLDQFDQDEHMEASVKKLRVATLSADDAIHTSRRRAVDANDDKPTASFWQRHSRLKHALIGGLITLGVIGTAMLMTAIIFLTVGAAAAPIGAFFAMLAAKVGVGGIVGLGFAASAPIIAAGAGIGAMIPSKTSISTEPTQPISSTTYRLIPDLGASVLPAHATLASNPSHANTERRTQAEQRPAAPDEADQDISLLPLRK